MSSDVHKHLASMLAGTDISSIEKILGQLQETKGGSSSDVGAKLSDLCELYEKVSEYFPEVEEKTLDMTK